MSKNPDGSERGLQTRLIHSGEPRPRFAGAVGMPIFQSSTFEDDGGGVYENVRYIRLSNTPNHEALHRKLADLEGSEASLVTSSGMSAITSALLSVAGAGDHLLVQDSLYGGTSSFANHDLPRLGIEVDWIDSRRPESWEGLVRERTRAIYVEALSNPLLEVPELEAVVGFARRHGLVSMIDNTFASPVNLRPCILGFDLVLHSATKSLNGHSDIVAGVIAGRESRVAEARHRLNHLGGSLDPHAAFLLHRGLKTLALRMGYQNRSTLEIADFLEQDSRVSKVHYAGLESHPDHARARSLFAGFGGVLSFELAAGDEHAEPFMRSLELPICAPSLGGVESLVTRPASTSHAGMDPEDRRRRGISDGLVRLSVGIEDTADLIADLDQALSAVSASAKVGSQPVPA